MKFIFLKKKHIILFILFTIIVFFCLGFIFINYFKIYANDKEKYLSIEKIEKIRNIYKSDEKIAYLTFDDGPSAKVTPKVLDVLKENQVLANFFVLGKQTEAFPEIVKQEYEEGHFIANHGYSHDNSKLYKSKSDFFNEILKTDEAISSAIGIENYHSHLFRFPNGSMSSINYAAKQKCITYLEEIDYTYIDWNALNNDSMKKYSNSQLLSNLKKSSANKGTLVILMHDTGDVNNTYDVLEDSINYLKSEGYSFKTFYDLLND